MNPALASSRLDWASTVGLFILNFGTLDLHVQDYLENSLPAEEFAKFRGRHFQDRIERLKRHVSRPDFEPEKHPDREAFFRRLTPIRELRNHIAHGLLRLTLAEDQKNWIITVSLPRDLDGTDSPTARHLTFEELLSALTELTDLNEEFMRLFGNWVTDGEL